MRSNYLFYFIRLFVPVLYIIIFRLLFYMQIFFVLVFFLLCIFPLWTDSLLLLAVVFSLVLRHLYRLFCVYSFPIFSLLYFLMYSDIVVNRFIVDEGRSLAVVTSIQSHRMSTKWYTRCILVRMCMHVARRRHEEERTMFRLGFILALSTFITLTGSFLFSILPSLLRVRQDDLPDWKLKNEFGFIELIRILPDILQNIDYTCYTFPFPGWNICQ